MPRVFPFSAFWRQSPGEEIPGRIDRHISDRMRRLMIGLHLTDDLCTVQGSLTVTSGRGKFIRVNHVFAAEEELPAPISAALRERIDQPGQEGAGLQQLTADLAQIQASCVYRLKVEAGKFVDRILAVSVTDPGIWLKDFDGQPTYLGLCHTSRLTELTGLSVIDSFPDRELAVGGAGKPLDLLPSWLLFGDRDRRIANNSRILLNFDRQTEIHMLPPSDGIDDRLPNLQYSVTVGNELIQRLTQLGPNPDAVDRLYADGRVEESLLKKLHSQASQAAGDIDPLVSLCRTHLADHQVPLSNIVRSAFELIVQQVKQQIRFIRGDVPTAPIDQIWIISDPGMESSLVNLLDQHFPVCSIRPIHSAESGVGHFRSTVAAILGLLHVDQMPANVPWITGASCQRILGRLSPGTPASYRQLLVTMADYSPPAMKLRDAI